MLAHFSDQDHWIPLDGVEAFLLSRGRTVTPPKLAADKIQPAR